MFGFTSSFSHSLLTEMGSQRKSSLGPHWFLTFIFSASVLLLPALSLNSLTCYFCPLQLKGKSCPNITSQCLPHQRCSSSRGHFGPVHMLSAQGCLDVGLCGSHETLSYRGVDYNVSYACCCKDKCNTKPKPESNLKMLLRMMAGKINHSNITSDLKEEPWGSCENYPIKS